MEQKKELQPICLTGGFHSYPPADAVLRTVRKGVAGGLNQNGDDIAAVSAAMAKEWKVPREQLLAVADRRVALKLLMAQVKEVWLPQCSEACYGEIARSLGVKITELPLKDDKTADLNAVGKKGAVLLANPGYPIGKGIDAAALEVLLASRSEPVIVDETYWGFGAESLLPLVKKYPHLAVVRSLEVSNALASLPVACIVRQNPNPLKQSALFSLPCALAQTAALASLKAKRTAAARRNTVRAVREGMGVALRSMGFEVIPSQGNFFMMKHWKHAAQAIALHLTEQGYLVDTVTLGGEDYVSVTVGTKEVMRNWIDIVENYIEEEWVLHRFDADALNG